MLFSGGGFASEWVYERWKGECRDLCLKEEGGFGFGLLLRIDGGREIRLSS